VQGERGESVGNDCDAVGDEAGFCGGAGGAGEAAVGEGDEVRGWVEGGERGVERRALVLEEMAGVLWGG
jgi:hypothetical protein